MKNQHNPSNKPTDTKKTVTLWTINNCLFVVIAIVVFAIFSMDIMTSTKFGASCFVIVAIGIVSYLLRGIVSLFTKDANFSFPDPSNTSKSFTSAEKIEWSDSLDVTKAFNGFKYDSGVWK